MYKIGLSSCGHRLDEEYFKMYQNAGITLMEIAPKDDEYGDVDYRNVYRLANRYGIKLWSYHLPFWPFTEIDISDKELCDDTIVYLTELIKKASDIGIDKFVIHPSGEPIEDPAERKERMKCSKESLARLAEIAKKHGAVIAAEDLPRSCLGKNSAEILELISAHEDLKVCFDTNHLLQESPAEFVRNVGKKIITTHVSDCDFINERHWLPGEGKIDWQELLQAFKDIDYDGVWLYEIGFACPRSIIRNRELNCEDFVKNAEELFNNKPITTFSEHIPGLGMWV